MVRGHGPLFPTEKTTGIPLATAQKHTVDRDRSLKEHFIFLFDKEGGKIPTPSLMASSIAANIRCVLVKVSPPLLSSTESCI